MRLAEPPVTLLNGASLFLDFDGTLVALAQTPDAVQVDLELVNLLKRIQSKLEGRVAVLSGRALADVRARLERVSLAIGGSHGLERAPAGGDDRIAERPLGLEAAIRKLRQFETRHPGVIVEEKPLGVALHYRLAPDSEIACHDAAKQVAVAIGLTLQFGKMVVELKPPDGDKGRALHHFMAESPFRDGRRPVFVGDDLTDEHAFVAARDLGGAGVLVGPERPTAAKFRLADVDAVRCWLQAACETLP
jgi:trehalose 6-phosphate phosphatase